jgi:cytochrome P450
MVDTKTHDRGDDLTSDLLANHDENPDHLSHTEIAAILLSLSFAGHETTTGLIGNTLRRHQLTPTQSGAAPTTIRQVGGNRLDGRTFGPILCPGL